MRLRGEITLWLEGVGAIGDGFTTYMCGIGIVSTDAFAIGATVMPTLSADADWGGWLWYHAGAAIVGASVTETFRGPMEAIRLPIDTKAMRKMHPNETVFGSVEVVAEVGAAILSFTMNSRMLLKLV